MNASGLAGRAIMCAAVAVSTGCADEGRENKPAREERQVLESRLGGTWYPAGAEALRAAIEQLLPRPKPPAASNICAALVPHAGYQFSGRVAAQVLARLDPRAYERVVLLAPSHYLPLRNEVSVPDVTHFRTPLGEVALDLEFLKRMRDLPGVVSDRRAHDREHAIQIQIPLLQTLFGERLRVVPIVVGQMTPGAALNFSQQLRRLLGARTLVLVSSDFTHYGPNFEYVPFSEDVPRRIEALDRRVFERFAAGDLKGYWEVLEDTGATVCGRCAIAILMGMLPAGARPFEVSYDTSGRMLQEWDNSVSYFGALVEGAWPDAVPSPAPAMLPEEARAQLLRLARVTLESAVRGSAMPTPEEAGITLTAPLLQTMGGFVTLTVKGQLRGCIGEIVPRRPIWEVVREQTVNAASNDPRFAAVTRHEAKAIRIEISALTPPREIASWREIEVGRHGVVLNRHGRSAVFLPQVAPEQGWDRDTMLTHLARKAGLPGDAWREGAQFSVFEAEVFHERQ